MLIQRRPGHHQDKPITAEPVLMIDQGWHHQGLSDQNGGWSAEGFELTGGMQGCEVVVAADRRSVDEHLGEGTHAAAGLAGLEVGVVVDGDHGVGQCHAPQQSKCAAAPGASREHRDFKPWGRRVRVGFSWGRGLIQYTHQQVNAFLHQRSRLKVAPPHLAGTIGEAQVEVHSLRRDRAIQGDHLKVSLQDCGLRLPRALEGRAAEIADHTEHKTVNALRLAELLKAVAQIAAWSKLQRQRAHGFGETWSHITWDGLDATKIIPGEI